LDALHFASVIYLLRASLSRTASALAARPFVSRHEVINMDPTITVLPY